MDWAKIVEGWRNRLIPPKRLKELIEQTARERMGVCEGCEFISSKQEKKGVRFDEHCVICGCTLSAKVRCLSCDCPLMKWVAVVDDDEEEILKTESDGEE